MRRTSRRPSKGEPWKLFYATQVGTAPPTFMLFANRTLPRAATPTGATWRTACAKSSSLRGVPIRLVIRRRARHRDRHVSAGRLELPADLRVIPSARCYFVEYLLEGYPVGGDHGLQEPRDAAQAA